MHQFHICWLRESHRDTTTADFATPATPSTLLDVLRRMLPDAPDTVARQLAWRILGVAPQHSATPVPVHLPFLSRGDWPRHAEVLAATGFRCSNGIILPDSLDDTTVNQHYMRIFGAAAFFPNPTGQFLLPGSEPLDLSRVVSWRTVPPEKLLGYFRTMAPVTTCLQTLLRGITLDTWLEQPLNCAFADFTQALILYSVSRPFQGRPRTEFTYDLMSADWWTVSLRGAHRAIDRQLAAVRAACHSIGRHDYARRYTGLNGKLLSGIAGSRRLLNIFAAEQKVINAFLMLAEQSRGCPDHRHFTRLLMDTVDDLDVRLRAFKLGPLTRFIPLLFVEATRAVSQREQRLNIAA